MRKEEEEDDDEVHNMFMCAPTAAAATFASFDDEYINNSVIKDSETTVLQTELEETVREMYLKMMKKKTTAGLVEPPLRPPLQERNAHSTWSERSTWSIACETCANYTPRTSL